jgi:tetratricopeptide (TPR) repeat protein
LGINLTSQGRFDEAYLNLKKGLELDPGNHVILLNNSVALIELGKYEEAETANKRGLSVNPNYYNNWELLYVNYVLQSSREKDIDDLINEIETLIDKNRQVYSILVHYYKDKDVKKSNEYLVKLKSYLKVSKSKPLEQYQILDDDFSVFMDRAEKAFEAKKLPYGFGSLSTTYYLGEYNDSARYKALVKKFREGR